MALARKEGQLAANGALVARTGAYTGRAAKDKYLVRRPSSEAQLAFGSVNQPMEPAAFERLWERAKAHFQGRELFVFDGWACTDPAYRTGVRLITENAWQALFARCLLFPATAAEHAAFKPNLLILHAPSLQFDPGRDQTRSEVGVMLDLDEHRVLIAGTQYAGEIKKSVFTYLNYWMPARDVFPMHCSATIGPAGDTALLFGLSGTGKTTLSADPERRLIGDDEHGWSPTGVFNFEGGCYAKCIKLSHVSEPQIWDAHPLRQRPGKRGPERATREPDYDDGSLTENTRAAYPLWHIDNAEIPRVRRASEASVVFDVRCVRRSPAAVEADARAGHVSFSVGLHGEDRGDGGGRSRSRRRRSAIASGLHFGPARQCVTPGCSRRRLHAHQATVWLVNTGWTGGGYGVGRHFPLEMTHRLVRAALSGALDQAAFAPDPVFGVLVPKACPDVPAELLQPRRTWADGSAYDLAARRLAELFRNSFKAFEAEASPECERRGQASPDPSPFGGLRRERRNA